MSYRNVLEFFYTNKFYTLHGEDYDSLQWLDGNTTPKPTKEELDALVDEANDLKNWQPIRLERNDKLRETDWMFVSDVPMDKTEKAAWKKYRQELRDIPQNNEYPDFVIWPDEPQ